jgi:hypothetical protein
MYIRRPFLLALMVVVTASAAALPDRSATATKAGGPTGDACLEKFHECQRGCGPTPGTADPQCMRYCEEQAKCRAGGAAVKSQTIKPGAVNGGLKAAPQ